MGNPLLLGKVAYGEEVESSEELTSRDRGLIRGLGETVYLKFVIRIFTFLMKLKSQLASALS